MTPPPARGALGDRRAVADGVQRLAPAAGSCRAACRSRSLGPDSTNGVADRARPTAAAPSAGRRDRCAGRPARSRRSTGDRGPGRAPRRRRRARALGRRSSGSAGRVPPRRGDAGSPLARQPGSGPARRMGGRSRAERRARPTRSARRSVGASRRSARGKRLTERRMASRSPDSSGSPSYRVVQPELEMPLIGSVSGTPCCADVRICSSRRPS